MTVLMETATRTTRTQPRDNTLVHFEIPASNPEKLRAFYEKLLSWKFNKMPAGTMDYWMISHKDAAKDETMGGLYKRTMGETGFINYFGVVNIDQSIAKATSLGARVVHAKEEIPNMGFFAILQDPDNNTFALFQSAGRR
jgi:uncharacterized protein